jgi:hypothetical protein
MNLTKSSAASSRDDVSHTTIPKTSKICGVCGDVARCYHFGGLCCASCKAFFRRAVVNDRYKQVHCTSYQTSMRIAYSLSVVRNQLAVKRHSSFIHFGRFQYRCVYGGSCRIDIISRKHCSHCRLKQCLAIGMDKKW